LDAKSYCHHGATQSLDDNNNVNVIIKDNNDNAELQQRGPTYTSVLCMYMQICSLWIDKSPAPDAVLHHAKSTVLISQREICHAALS